MAYFLRIKNPNYDIQKNFNKLWRAMIVRAIKDKQKFEQKQSRSKGVFNKITQKDYDTAVDFLAEIKKGSWQIKN